MNKHNKVLMTITLNKEFNIENLEDYDTATDAIVNIPDIYGIDSLLKELEHLVDNKLEQLEDEYNFSTTYFGTDGFKDNKSLRLLLEIKKYKAIKESCKNWNIEDCDIINK